MKPPGKEPLLLVGEALIGEEPDIAHVDLIVGPKSGPVGQAFATALAHPVQGHTAISAVIRPNLPVKPSTLIVPKLTLRNLEDADKIFGPAQSAVAKAIADAVGEGLFPAELAEEWVVVASVFIHPRAKDYSRLYRYNYGATKLALRRALTGFPSVAKVLEEKDKALHPSMNFRPNNLSKPPLLEVAIDIPEWRRVESVVAALPRSDALIIEAGTPLVKRYGVEVCQKIHQMRPESFVICDLKTLDTGHLEARIAADATADAVTVSGLASRPTIEKFIDECAKVGVHSMIDMINVPDPLALVKSLPTKPSIVELHRGIDTEGKGGEAARGLEWGDIRALKAAGGPQMRVAVAGGIRLDRVPLALDAGADILVVGRAITQARNVARAAWSFLQAMRAEEIDQFRVMTDF